VWSLPRANTRAGIVGGAQHRIAGADLADPIISALAAHDFHVEPGVPQYLLSSASKKYA
jgi:hypothetical protein